MHRLLALLLPSLLCQSCVYSVSFNPPPAPESAAPGEPLSLTVTLDHLEVYEEGWRRKAGDADWEDYHRGFNDALRRAGLFTVLEPHALQANLRVEEAFRMGATEGSRATALGYGALILPMFLPIPFPLLMDCSNEVAFRTEFAGEPMTVRQYKDKYVWRVLLASVWAPLVSQRELREGLTEHHARMLRSRVNADSAFFTELAPLLIAGDKEATRALVARAAPPDLMTEVRK